MTSRRGHGGRPKLREAEPGEKITISVRITPKMRAQLEDISNENGRSMSQEAELRLERSLERQHLLSEVLTLAYGPRIAGLLLLTGYAMDVAVVNSRGGQSGEDWADDPAASQSVAETLRLIADLLPMANARQDQPGKESAAEFAVGLSVRMLTRPKVQIPGTPIAEIRALLGSEMLTKMAQVLKTSSTKRRT
jgi:hypothetical protein